MAGAAVRVGILLPTREAVMSGRSDARPLLEIAERAEAAGILHLLRRAAS